uniref:Uncharacterized protein n=2 Tax=Meloidogyne TaxID=189290 RepID=A0A6V7VEL6_MELEN|nr:unnamed protein product [Meloidogyne enterolobii]
MSNRALLILSSFIEANGLGRPDLWGKAILSLQAIHLLINTYLETKFLWPIISSIFSSQPYSSSNNNNLLFPQFPTFLSISLSIYFIFLQIIAMILLLIQLFKSTVLLPLIIIHLLLICSIMFQLLQLLTEGHPTTELFVWFWYLSACITFTLYQAMLFSTTRSPKLSDSIAPAPNRARIVWIQQTNINIPLQQNQRLLTLERRPSSSNIQLESLININEINN